MPRVLTESASPMERYAGSEAKDEVSAEHALMRALCAALARSNGNLAPTLPSAGPAQRGGLDGTIDA